MTATEHGHMASVPDMYMAFSKYGLKYVPGCEIYYNDWEPQRQSLEASGIKIRSQAWRQENIELSQRMNRNRHLTVLCKNERGFQNLVKLTTQAYDTGLFGVGRTQYNRIWFEQLAKYKEGLIVLSGCLNGPVSHELRWSQVTDREGNIIRVRSPKERLQAAVDYIKKFKSLFGEDYYIELQMPGVEDDQQVFKWLIELADKFKLKTVLANDSHYLDRKDYIIQKIMMAVQQETTIDSPDLFHVNSDEQYMKSRPELYDRFKNHGYSDTVDDGQFEKMCDHTLEIMQKCEKIQFDMSPKIPEIENADDTLKRIVAQRLKQLGLDKDTKRYFIDGREVTYVEQAKIELKRFIDKGFASYMLITMDLVRFGKEKGWPFAPRGCCSPESKVRMANGELRSICNIDTGHQVLDGFGHTQTVKTNFVYEIDEHLVVLPEHNISVTMDHQLYIIREGKAVVVQAGFLKSSDKLISCCVDNAPRVSNCKRLQYLYDTQQLQVHDAQFEFENYSGQVYDICVSNTNCYQLGGIFSSNSAGGSLMCYLLGISSIDPLKWGLSFDRFLSPSRGGYMLNVKM